MLRTQEGHILPHAAIKLKIPPSSPVRSLLFGVSDLRLK
jgi:hypothetical protein